MQAAQRTMTERGPLEGLTRYFVAIIGHHEDAIIGRFSRNRCAYVQGSGIGGGGYTPLAGKILNIPLWEFWEKYTPLGGAKRRRHFFWPKFEN